MTVSSKRIAPKRLASSVLLAAGAQLLDATTGAEANPVPYGPDPQVGDTLQSRDMGEFQFPDYPFWDTPYPGGSAHLPGTGIAGIETFGGGNQWVLDAVRSQVEHFSPAFDLTDAEGNTPTTKEACGALAVQTDICIQDPTGRMMMNFSEVNGICRCASSTWMGNGSFPTSSAGQECDKWNLVRSMEGEPCDESARVTGVGVNCGAICLCVGFGEGKTNNGVNGGMYCNADEICEVWPGSTGTACTEDSDCTMVADDVCSSGVCTTNGDTGTACSATADCIRAGDTCEDDVCTAPAPPPAASPAAAGGDSAAVKGAAGVASSAAAVFGAALAACFL